MPRLRRKSRPITHPSSPPASKISPLKPGFSATCSHVRFQGAARSFLLRRRGLRRSLVRTAGDRTRRRRLNKLSCAGWIPHDRGFVWGCLGLEASVGLGRLITGLEGSPPRSCLRRRAPLDLLALASFPLCRRMAGSGRERRLRNLGDRPDETDHLAGYGGRDHDLWLAGGG